MAKKRLLIIGKSYIDYVAYVRRAPERTECVVSNLEHFVLPGGFGVICAVTAANMGIDSVLCTRIGEDENARKLRVALTENDVDTRFIVTDKRKNTGVNAITVEDSHKARTVIFEGANNSISFDDIESSFTSYPDAVLLNFDLRDDMIYDTVKFAQSNDIPVILSCGNEITAFDFPSLKTVEIFSVNKLQTYKITGIDPIDADSALRACVKLANIIKAKYIVLKLGERGTFVFESVYSKIIPMHKCDIIDMTGSEAIFDAVLSAMYLELSDINKAAEYANAAASFSSGIEGIYPSVPKIADLNKLLIDN